MDSFDEKFVHLLWTVTSDFTAIPEKFTLVLTGVNSDNSVTIKFKSCPISVNSDETWEFLPSPELSEQLLNQTQSEVQKAIDAANRAEIASQTPAPAEIYPATTTRLGGVKVDGKTITAGEDGTISAPDSETLKNEIADVKSSQKSISNLAVQIAHPNNYLIYDDLGKPSVMVAIPKFYLDDVIDGASHTVHPAFIINGVEQEVIFISKYQNIVENGRAYSLPMKNPLTRVSFEQAYDYCKAKGAGWHLMTNAEWAAIALWCKKNGTMPKGNSNYGKDFSEADLPQNAIPATYGSDGKINKILTGSGSESWYHNEAFSGIADLNGNINEWNAGVRLNNGEIQIIANNDAADWNNSVSPVSTLWKALMPNGLLVAPDTNGALKYSWESGIWTINTAMEKSSMAKSTAFKSLAVNNNVIIPEILKALALYSTDSKGYNNDVVYLTNSGERIIVRGGSFANGEMCGVFNLAFSVNQTYLGNDIGFRCAYYGNI